MHTPDGVSNQGIVEMPRQVEDQLKNGGFTRVDSRQDSRCQNRLNWSAVSAISGGGRE